MSSFRTTRDPSFRFRNGEFTMIGIEVDGRPLLRAYSVASVNYEEQLEFLSIKFPEGPLTSRLKDLQVGDPVIVNMKRPALSSSTSCMMAATFTCSRPAPASRHPWA